MAQFQLQPVTKDTIICNITNLTKAKQWLVDVYKNEEYELDVTSYSGLNGYDYPFNEIEHEDIKPWLTDYANILYATIEALANFFKQLPEDVESRYKHVDTINDYMPDKESRFQNSEAIENKIADILEEKYTALYEEMSHTDLAKIIKHVIEQLADIDPIGIAEDSYPYSKCPEHLTEVYAFDVGEVEEQVEISTLYDLVVNELKEKKLNITLLEFIPILDQLYTDKENLKWSTPLAMKNIGSSFWVYVNTDLVIFYGYEQEQIEQAIVLALVSLIQTIKL